MARVDLLGGDNSGVDAGTYDTPTITGGSQTISPGPVASNPLGTSLYGQSYSASNPFSSYLNPNPTNPASWILPTLGGTQTATGTTYTPSQTGLTGGSPYTLTYPTGAGANYNTPNTSISPSSMGADQYILQLIQSGMDPQAAVDKANSAYGLGYGNSAVYYPNNQTIGLPGSYLAYNNGTWGITQRSPETGSGSNIFTDPATAAWESALNQLAGQFQTPMNNSGYQPLVDYLQSYFQQLQQPAYSPAQRDVITTDFTDPLMAQRDAARQTIIQHFAAAGIPTTSGIVQDALNKSDQQFSSQLASNQGQLATNEINLGRQNQQTAAQVGAAINQLQTARTQQDLQNSLQGLSLLFQVPQYADQRLALAQGTLQQLNPSSLLANQYQFGNLGLYQNQQSAQYYQQLGQLIANAIGQSGLFS